jgi:hypothetical protein
MCTDVRYNDRVSKSQCSAPGCETRVQAHKLCHKHLAGIGLKQCAAPGCQLQVRSHGLCYSHLAESGHVPQRTPWRSGQQCLVDDCPDPSKSLGYCNFHYQRNHVYGDPLGGPKRRKRRDSTPGPCAAPGCDRQRDKGSFCPTHYMRMRTHGDARPNVPIRASGKTPMNERVWRKVNKYGPIPSHRPDLGPCWIWEPAPRGAGGYARVQPNDGSGRTVRVHVWTYEQENGPVPAGLELDHLCCVRHCVRPSHLEAVTHKENVQRGMAHRRRRLNRSAA